IQHPHATQQSKTAHKKLIRFSDRNDRNQLQPYEIPEKLLKTRNNTKTMQTTVGRKGATQQAFWSHLAATGE
ncbi:hypothetical protein M8C21_018699, partial [Ambrosia artemisiifolia]